MAETVNTQLERATFFETIFGDREGYVCIAHAQAAKQAFKETYFKWPKDIAKMMKHIDTVQAGHNVWFCAQLLDEPKRIKENISQCTALWADLDECSPYDLIPPPPIVLKSSVDRWQAFWPLEDAVPAIVAEDYSHRIAYHYKDKGVDQSGWDLTQLLRVPYTFNYKYPGRPYVDLEMDTETKFPARKFREEFEAVPKQSVEWVDPPSRLLNAETIIAKYRPRLEQYVIDIYRDEPPDSADWSAVLWRFMLTLYEAGMDRDEVYAVAATAACNKFHRDGKPERLWPDVLRAETTHLNARPIQPLTTLPDFKLEYHTGGTFIEAYADWAENQVDAPREYHEAGAFMILSAIISSGMEIETSIGNLKTNLWILILGETTLTRKTTAMRMAMKMLGEVDDDAMLATDEGSIEGIMDAMQLRPHKASVFYRDEIAGMFKSMVRKDYLSGMLESFTKLYDGDNFKRLLRKEVIHVRDPIFIFFGGGIRQATLGSMREEHLTSGFIPRFLWVIGETSPERIRPLGKRTDDARAGEDALIQRLGRVHRNYNRTQIVEIAGQSVEIPASESLILADLTDEAWELYNSFDNTFITWANEQQQRDLIMPIMSRTATNALKMAALLAAERQEPSIDSRVTVEATDLAHALKYVLKWMPHTMEVIANAGVSAAETLIRRVHDNIKRQPGIQRSTLMRNHHLTARDFQQIQDTLRERMLIRVEKDGKSELHYSTD